MKMKKKSVIDMAIDDIKKHFYPEQLSPFETLPSGAKRIYCNIGGGYDAFDIDERYFLKIGPKAAYLEALIYFNKIRIAREEAANDKED